MTIEADTQTHARELVAQVQLAQLRFRLGLVPALEPTVLDPSGRFEIVEVIGAGGMGVVFLGHDTKLDRRVALKLLRRRTATPEQLEERLLHEAKILASLHDRNILVVFDVGQAQSGELFVAMQYVAGQTLREWQIGRSLVDILSAYIEAGRGLAAAHERGIVHRDFKPENVLLEPGSPPRVYVGDFGLADVPDDERLASHSTRTRLGTPAYMAPEQLRCGPASPSSDQYAYCVALWEACVGTRPSPHARPPRPSAMPRWLYRLLATGLNPRPEDRHASLALLLERLERARRGRSRAWMIATALALLGVGGVLGEAYANRSRDCARMASDDGVWSSTSAARLYERLAASPSHYAPATSARMTAELLTNVSARRQLAEQLCSDRERAPDTPLLERRAACIETWRLRTREQIDALLAIDDGGREHAESLLAPLERLSEICRRGGVPAPLHPLVAGLLAQANNAMLLRRHQQAMTAGELALALAERLGRPCTEQGASLELGHANHQLGRIHFQAEQPELAREHFLRALNHAGSCNDRELNATLHVELARLYALQLEDVGAAESHLAIADGELRALGVPSISTQRAELLEAEGFLALAEGRLPAAIDSYRLALAALPDGQQLHTAKLYSNIGAAQLEHGELADALESFELAWATAVSQLTDTHPQAQAHLRTVRLNEGMLASDRGLSESARGKLQPLFDAPEPAIRIQALACMLRDDFASGRELTPEHRAQAQLLIAVLREHPELTPRIRAEGLSIAGHVLSAIGDSSGFALIREGLELWREHFPRDENTAAAAIGLAQALHFAGRGDEALDAARAARRLEGPFPAELEHELVELQQELGM